MCHYFAVNSDRQRSVGHFTRCGADDFAETFAAWLNQQHILSALPRLSLSLGGESFRILNDCLVTTSNPGMMSRYHLITPAARADQWSPGPWASTAAAGSTGAIHSAGFSEPITPTEAALCWQVREPFSGRHRQELTQGLQQPVEHLRIIPAIPGMACYIDGGHAN